MYTIICLFCFTCKWDSAAAQWVDALSSKRLAAFIYTPMVSHTDNSTQKVNGSGA